MRRVEKLLILELRRASTRVSERSPRAIRQELLYCRYMSEAANNQFGGVTCIVMTGFYFMASHPIMIYCPGSKCQYTHDRYLLLFLLT